MKKIIKVSKKIAVSNKGAGIMLLMIILVPLMLIIPAIAIDVSVYLAARSQMANTLDAIGESALNNSTDDAYRSDKVLHIITDPAKNLQYNYFAQVREGVRNNLRPKNNSITVLPDPTDPTNPLHKVFEFEPTYSIAASKAVLTAKIDKAEADTKDTAIDNSSAPEVSVNLTLSSTVNLPVSGKVLKMFNLGDYFKANITVQDTVRGIRIKDSYDFGKRSWE